MTINSLMIFREASAIYKTYYLLQKFLIYSYKYDKMSTNYDL